MHYNFDDCTLDPQRYELRRGGMRMPLRRKVFQVLVYLIEQRDRVVSRDEVLAQVWPDQYVGEETLTAGWWKSPCPDLAGGRGGQPPGLLYKAFSTARDRPPRATLLPRCTRQGVPFSPRATESPPPHRRMRRAAGQPCRPLAGR